MESDKPIVLILLVAVLVLFSLFLVLPPIAPPHKPNPPVRVTPPPAPNPQPLFDTPPPAPGSSPARELNAPGGTVQRDVEVLRGMVGQLLLVVKEPHRPPLGINEDFARALTGANQANRIIIPPGHPAVAGGKIVDRWGTPYFFHPRAADAIDIRSAGPDRKLFTDDDVASGAGAQVSH